MGVFFLPLVSLSEMFSFHVNQMQWRRKVPKSVCVCVGGGGGTQTRDLSTFGKELI